MDALTVTQALRNIAAGMAELALIVLALIAMAWAINVWINRDRSPQSAEANKEKITRGFPTQKQERALEAANRSPVVLPKQKP